MGGRARVKPPIKIVVEKFINIFSGLSFAHGSFKKSSSKLPGKAEGISLVKREEVTSVMWENHLNGIGPSLGIMPVTEESLCRWGCIDVDDFNLDYEDILKDIRRLNLPLVMCRSKSGCAHIFLFITKLIPAEEVQFVMRKFAAELGIADKMDRIYPMQTEFSPGGTGSWLNMPYFNHEEGTRYAYKDDFEAATIGEFFEMYEQYAQENLDKYLTVEQKTEEKTIKDKKIKKPPLLPCMENCLKKNKGKIPTGMRNEFAFQAAWFFNRAHGEISKFEGEIKTPEALLRDFNANKISPSLEEKEITAISNSLAKNEYKPKCKVPCIRKYCDVGKCRKNLFGVDPEQARDLLQVEDILGAIHEYGSVPPIFHMYIKVKAGENKLKVVRVVFKGSELKDKRIFMTKLHDYGHFPPKALEQMKSPDFSDFIDSKLAIRSYEKATEEANVDYDFTVLIKDFLEKTTVSLNKADLIEGACYYDEKKKLMHFKLDKLQSYLTACRQPMNATELTYKITHILKGKKNNGKVKNRLGKEKSCPTWAYQESRDNFVITLDGSPNQKVIDDKN